MQEKAPDEKDGRSRIARSSHSPRAQWPSVRPSGGLRLLAVVLLVWILWVVRDRQFLWFLGDLRVYVDGGNVFRTDPSQLYVTQLGGWLSLPFTYPPFAALVFSLFSWLPFGLLKIGSVVLALLSLIACALAVLTAGGRRLSSGTIGMALALAALSWLTEPVQQTLSFGQVNLALMALVTVDILVIRGRARGVGVGIAAGFKLVPLIFIPYLILIRAYRAAAMATGVFLGTILIPFLLAPGASESYWGGLFLQGASRVAGNSRVSNQATYAVLLRLYGTSSLAKVLWLACCVLIAGVGLYAASRQFHRGRHSLALFSAAVVGLLASPLSWSHHWVWIEILVAAILVEARGVPRAWRTVLASGVLLTFLAWPIHLLGRPLAPGGVIWFMPHSNGVEAQWHGWELFFGNLYPILGVGYLLAAFTSVLWRDKGAVAPWRSPVAEPATPRRAASPLPV